MKVTEHVVKNKAFVFTPEEADALATALAGNVEFDKFSDGEHYNFFWALYYGLLDVAATP